MIFLASGLALLLFRDSVIPLRPRTRRLVLGAVALTALFLIALQLVYGRNAPKPLQFAALVAFIVVWSGCVGEPSIRLWLNARRRTAVQRARMRALSLGYLGIIAILLAAVFTASLAKEPAVQIGFALASIAIVPLLYAGFAAPTWLRRAWRQGEESKFQQATHDIVIFSTDQTALARRALEWAVRLTGTDSGFFASGTIILATHGMSQEEAQQVKAQVGSVDKQRTVPLGRRPPRTAIAVGLPAGDASLVLVLSPGRLLRHTAVVVPAGRIEVPVVVSPVLRVLAGRCRMPGIVLSCRQSPIATWCWWRVCSGPCSREGCGYGEDGRVCPTTKPALRQTAF